MQILLRAVRWASLISFPLFVLAVPNSAVAGNIGICADSLISSGVDKSDAATACSDAVEPTDLAACVDQIKVGTSIKGNEALQACYRVRRPDELASCVTTISDGKDPAKSAMALDSCRRSLLPERHAECTLDLTTIAKISSEEAMKSCIAAELTPSEVAPKTPE
jgi:hypothetical protein